MELILSDLFSSNEAKMTSLDIAELVGSRHDKVKQSIKRLSTNNKHRNAIISQPPMVDGIKSANGVVTQVYVFQGEKAKRDSLVVVAQLSPEFTADIVDRWIYLEKQNLSLTKQLEYWQRKEMVDFAEGSFHGHGLAKRKETKKLNNGKIEEIKIKMQPRLEGMK
ncbi:Rha family transcriptional regulator [Psychrobacter sp. FME13]|uniref:Rha family transcriptional regulator n=1 Tax=Psychrobacter sp. FME13 TaxID=2487708 RepID=UPI0017887582|nr:Rha family transcriptional regulator [Psychrobacter sp. FME13]MBE0440579.1 Rha family transcriptional regulator [Psychrobacter sp. FME13]